MDGVVDCLTKVCEIINNKLISTLCTSHLEPRHLGTRGWPGLLLLLTGICMKFCARVCTAFVPGFVRGLHHQFEEPGRWCRAFTHVDRALLY